MSKGTLPLNTNESLTGKKRETQFGIDSGSDKHQY